MSCPEVASTSGVGVGWQREEYEAVGLSFEERGRLLDHTLEVCQLLWTQQRAVLRLARAVLRRHPPDAEAATARRCSRLDQRHGEHAGGTPVEQIRHPLDSVGLGDRRPR